jgi:hypothetical protein
MLVTARRVRVAGARPAARRTYSDFIAEAAALPTEPQGVVARQSVPRRRELLPPTVPPSHPVERDARDCNSRRGSRLCPRQPDVAASRPKNSPANAIRSWITMPRRIALMRAMLRGERNGLCVIDAPARPAAVSLKFGIRAARHSQPRWGPSRRTARRPAANHDPAAAS